MDDIPVLPDMTGLHGMLLGVGRSVKDQPNI